MSGIEYSSTSSSMRETDKCTPKSTMLFANYFSTFVISDYVTAMKSSYVETVYIVFAKKSI